MSVLVAAYASMATPDPAGDGGDQPPVADPRGRVAVKARPKTRKPSMYKVLLLNDDYTPMDFVVDVLEKIFNKSRDDATQIMLQIHRSGSGICGIYTHEIAETKVALVLMAARAAEHPLQCVMEKA